MLFISVGLARQMLYVDLLRPDALDGVVDLAVNHGQRHLMADGDGDVVSELDD